VAWKGTYPGQPEPELLVEACSYRGRPVYFNIVHPWVRPWRMQVHEPEPAERVGAILGVGMVLVLVLGALYLARRNLLAGRGDRRGALRLSVFVFVAVFLQTFVFTADHVAELDAEFELFMESLGYSAFSGLILWLVYLAIEPFVRRRWPQLLVSWNRLLAGRFLDPLVGRHLLIGAAFGVVVSGFGVLQEVITRWAGLDWADPWSSSILPLQGTRHVAAQLIGALMAGIVPAVVILFFLVLFRVVLRRPWAAFAGVTVLFGLFSSLGQDNFAVHLSLTLLGTAAVVFCLIRFGFLAGMASILLANFPSHFPVPAQPAAWYARPSWIAVAIVGALLVCAFYASLGSRSLIRPEALD
jgi:serine/threonine-protein kinase